MTLSVAESPIPVDSLGRAHVFKLHQPETNQTKQQLTNVNDEEIRKILSQVYKRFL